MLTPHQSVFIDAERALTDVVMQIKDDQWSMQLGPEFIRRDKKPVTLRQIINYHAYDDSWVPDTLSGKTIEEVGDKYGKPDGDLLGTDPKESWQEIVDRSIVAVEGCDPKKTVHLTYGDYPAHEYLRHMILFRGFRAIDIARAMGTNDQMPDKLLHGMWDLIIPDAEELRKIGVYQKAISVPDDAPLQARLLGLTGRQP